MSRDPKPHRNLVAWQKSMDLVMKVYKLTRDFPEKELYGLSSQLRRAAVSVPSNIAEGAERNSKQEYIRFVHIAKGSAAELRTQLYISHKIGVLQKNLVTRLTTESKQISAMLQGLADTLKKRQRVTSG